MAHHLLRNFGLTLLICVIYEVRRAAGKKEKNCLLSNPRTLHGEFVWYNKNYDPWNVGETDILQMIKLFSTRFDRAYIMDSILINRVFDVAMALAKYREQGNHSVTTYFATHPGDGATETSYNDTIIMLKQILNLTTEVQQIDNGTIGGLILRTGLKTYNEDLKAFEEVFGPIENLNFKIGIEISEEEFNKNFDFFKKMSFIVVVPRYILKYDAENLQYNAEISAERILDTCEKFVKDAKTRKIEAEILCRVSYPSEIAENANKDVTRSTLKGFSAFWCKIVQKLSSGETEANIIMRSAFDESPNAFPHSSSKARELHYGWWNTSHLTSGIKFGEKIDANEEKVPEKSYNESYFCSYSGYIVGITILFLSTSVLGGILMWMIFRNEAYWKNVKLTAEDVRLFEQGKAGSTDGDSNHEGLLVPYDKSFEIPKSSLIINTAVLLGKGEHGAVYSGKITNKPETVAVKTTTTSSPSSTSAKQLLAEIKILIHVGKHRNVVSLIGACTGEKILGNVSLILEYCELGSLHQVLRQRQKFLLLCGDNARSETDIACELDRYGRKWAMEIACGMEHISSKKVVHGDLAARNVLISSKGEAKITDFGLSRKLYSYSDYVKQKQEPLPWRWMAPESLKQMVFSSESDVWAFGVTLFEIFSEGTIPFPGMVWDQSFVDILEGGYINSKPEACADKIYDAMKSCWQVEPTLRPSFSELFNTLKNQNPMTRYTLSPRHFSNLDKE